MFSNEQAKGAIIQLERGIALSQSGKFEEAVKAFDKALQDARVKPGSWEQGLHQRMYNLKIAEHSRFGLRSWRVLNKRIMFVRPSWKR